MLTFTELLVYGLAIFRIASLLVNETGPFHVFRRLRELVGIKHYDNGTIQIIPDNFPSQVLSCVWCSSLWVAFAFAIFMYYLPVATFRVATVFAFSTVVILIDLLVKRLKWVEKQ